MQYYKEEKMHDLRLRIEKEVLSWPGVTARKMYGCPCYKNKEKLFAFLVTDGVVLTKLNQQDAVKLSKEFAVKPFQAGRRTMNKWPQVSVQAASDVQKILPFIKSSYSQSAMS
jgi:hypothetical protein